MQKCDFNKAEVTLLYGCAPLNCLNIQKAPFVKNTFG